LLDKAFGVSLRQAARINARHGIPVNDGASAVVGDQGCWVFGERSKDLVVMLTTMKPKDGLGHEEPWDSSGFDVDDGALSDR
jgi:hypothetical protein